MNNNMSDTLTLACSRVWLLKIAEMGESYHSFNGAKKRALFVRGNNAMENGLASISLIIAVDGDCLLFLDGRTLHGKVARTCSSNIRNGFQYFLRVDGRFYKFTVLDDYKTAVFEEIMAG